MPLSARSYHKPTYSLKFFFLLLRKHRDTFLNTVYLGKKTLIFSNFNTRTEITPLSARSYSLTYSSLTIVNVFFIFLLPRKHRDTFLNALYIWKKYLLFSHSKYSNWNNAFVRTFVFIHVFIIDKFKRFFFYYLENTEGYFSKRWFCTSAEKTLIFSHL